MINPIIKHLYSYCRTCDTDTVDCYDVNHRKINYTSLLTTYDKGVIIKKLDSVTIAYMKCSKCDTVSTVDWRNGLPRPLFKMPVLF